jgi:hypothetical protein
VVLADEQVRTLITPCHDRQGISDEAELDAVRALAPGMALARRRSSDPARRSPPLSITGAIGPAAVPCRTGEAAAAAR